MSCSWPGNLSFLNTGSPRIPVSAFNARRAANIRWRTWNCKKLGCNYLKMHLEVWMTMFTSILAISLSQMTDRHRYFLAVLGHCALTRVMERQHDNKQSTNMQSLLCRRSYSNLTELEY